MVSGAAYAAAMVTLAVLKTPLGAPLYFAFVGVGVVAWGLVLLRLWRGAAAPRRLFFTALLFAVLFRVPLAVSPVGSDNDMIRYLWDGRVQRLGINPYLVLPADLELAWTHTEETRDMPSARQRTPYPPAAQLFFRLVVTIRDSPRAMKMALVLCDLLTILVVWRWLLAIGLSEWLTLAYAWNPLVVLEVAHSGHIDALGALWIAAAALWLARGRTLLATIAFVLAVATKVLPIVLVPLLWRRVSTRDAVFGGALFLLLYLPFSGGPQLALGGVSRVVAHIRFNGPVFQAIRDLSNPVVAAGVAVLLGLVVAVWCRWKLGERHPASWAWPMAASLVCAPVIYPWYLLYTTPFLLTPATLPIAAWTVSVVPVYLVWHFARSGGRWIVPGEVIAAEFAIVILAAAFALWRVWRPRVIPGTSSPA